MRQVIFSLMFTLFVVGTIYEAEATLPASCDNQTTEINASCFPGNLQQAVDMAIDKKLPLHFYPGTYELTSPLVVDYAPNRGTGFILISDGAVIDATSINTSGPAIEFICTGGTAHESIGCFYLNIQGTLFVNARKPGYVVALGLPNYADAHNSIKIDHLIINNGNTSSTSSGLQINYVLNSHIFTVSVSGGGGAGIGVRQMQFSKLTGAGSATTGTGLLFENGYIFSNTIEAIDLEVAKTCMVINSPNAYRNTFISPYFNCPIPITSTAGSSNILINPVYGMAKTPKSLKGIKVIQ